MKLHSIYHRQLLLKAIAKLREAYESNNVEEAINLIERVLYEE